MLSQQQREQRILDNSIPEPNSGCWFWLGTLTAAGYGVIGVNYKKFYAHRLSYEAFKGNIPEGLEIDHLCRVRCCVNPDHLEAVTHRVNNQRGDTGKATGARNKAKTHCPRGHPYSGLNLYVSSKGARHCRTCLARSSSANYLTQYETKMKPVVRRTTTLIEGNTDNPRPI